MIRAGLALALTVLAWAPPVPGQSPPAPAALPAAPFPVGERLVYEVIFGFLKLGRAEMEIAGVDTVRGQPAIHVRFLLEGGSWIYPIRNRMDSWIGMADTASRRFTQDFDERGRKRTARYEIFPDSGYYRQEGVDSLRPTSERPLDDAAFFYFVRTTPLEPGRRYEFHRYFRPDRNPVVLDVQSRDTLDVPAGRYPALVVQPIIKGRGILAESSDAKMWLSDDDRRIMVQLKTRFSFGVITLRLLREEWRTGSTDAGL